MSFLREQQIWQFSDSYPLNTLTPSNSYNVSSENLVSGQLIIPKLTFFFILITCLVDIVLIL